uniref:Vigilin n=1 Tax=Echeneis naucrates TaxID=173247 RepID=A0A665W5G2_ECHNA
MSSVAVLTQESFNEHRSGLLPEQSRGPSAGEDEDALPTYKEAFPPLPEKAASPEGTQETVNAWTSKIRPLKSSIITQVFHVPLEERKYKDINQFGEGDQAKVCVDIMHKTGAHLELSLAKDQGLSIMVSGKLDAVMKARKEIVSRLQTQASATVGIPKEHHRFVIGKNGEKLQELELKTATKIQIPRPDDPSNQIKISGTKEGLEKAKHEILLISAEQDKRAVERVNIDKVYHPFITGAYNKLVGDMMQETGARINVPPPSVNKSEIVITGEKEQVALAVAMIKKIYEDKKNATTIAVEVKKSQHKYVIGPKGNTLQEILDKTGVSVEIPPSDSSSETVILRGEPDRLGQALTEVYAKANSYTVSSVSASSWLHRFIIGKKGQNLAKITQQMPKVHIEFTEGEDKITLEGPTKDVQMVQSQIEAIVTDLVSRMDYAEISVDPKFHRHLIGKGGVNINRIKELHKVTVRIPPDNEKSNLIRIEGDPQGVQEAKKELLELASRMENERTKDLIIEQRFHRAIIGQKGEKIKEVRDKFPEVIINFPDPAQKSDIVQLRGPRTEVEKCSKFMQKIVAEMVENSYSVSVPIFKQFHRNIIGKGGSNIKKECGGVHIHFPTEGSGIDKVTIRGPVEEVEKAKQQLLGLAEEKVWTKNCFCAQLVIHYHMLRTIKIIFFFQQTKSHTAELRAKPEYHKFLIGKGGGNIRKVRDSTGARIIFPTSDDKDQELITVVGTEEAVQEAQKELEELIKSLDNVVEDTMNVDPKHHRYFVARRGQVLRDLADEYGGVLVSFPRTGSQSEKVTLKGAKECVEAAKKRMSDPSAPPAEAPIQENGEANGEVKEPVDPNAPKKCDVIVLSGRKERCDAAVEALKALVPVTIEVEVPFELHRYIIGQKGSGIRKMMDEFEVNIQVPAPDQQSDKISITGLAHHLDRAKEGLLERVKELQAEQEDRALRSFKLTITVDPKYHPKIIGRKGAIITNIRTEHDVNIQFPEKNDENQDQITITGYEHKAIAARDAIKAIVDELEEMISEDITLDSRVHARIIGARGKGIRKIMDEFKVDLRFPQSGAADPNLVTVTGRPELVDEAIDHLLNLEEEYMADVVENEAKMAYMRPSGGSAAAMEENRGPSKGFVVREAPWTTGNEKAPDMTSSEDFPSFGAPVTTKTSPWGPKRF